MLDEPLLPTQAAHARCGFRLSTPMLRPPELRLGDPKHTATYKERFFDLMFMLVIGSLTKLPLDVPGMLQLAFYFALLWNLWVGVAFFNTRFDTDDIVARMSALADMVGVVGMASAAALPPDAIGFGRVVGCYAAVRAVLVLKYMRCWAAITSNPQLTRLLGGIMGGFALGVCAWVVAIGAWETHPPLARAAVALGLLCDYGTPFALLRWMVPVHHLHMPQRFAGFVALMFIGVLFNAMQTCAHTRRVLVTPCPY